MENDERYTNRSSMGDPHSGRVTRFIDKEDNDNSTTLPSSANESSARKSLSEWRCDWLVGRRRAATDAAPKCFSILHKSERTLRLLCFGCFDSKHLEDECSGLLFASPDLLLCKARKIEFNGG